VTERLAAVRPTVKAARAVKALSVRRIVETSLLMGDHRLIRMSPFSGFGAT
jgi:hypothetical protein